MSRPVALVVVVALAIGVALAVGAFFRPAHPYDAIERSVSTQGNVRLVTWADGVTGDRRTIFEAQGRPRIETVAEGSALVLVDFGARSWTSRTEPAALGAEGSFAELAAHTRSELASGFYTVVGHGVVDGRRAVHLRHHARLPSDAPARTLTIDRWVDAATFLPLRDRSVAGPATSRTTYEWLPRTAATMAHLRLTIPAGFARAPSRAGSRTCTRSRRDEVCSSLVVVSPR